MLLTLVLNFILVHGYSPDSMLVGTVVPIPKDKIQFACTSDNVMLLYYLRNNMRLQHRICNLKTICPLLLAHML